MKSVICGLLIIPFTILAACKLEVTVPENGRVVSNSGTYSCDAGQTCAIEVVDSHFAEVFVAKPDQGFEFSHWRRKESGLCGGETRHCRLDALDFEGGPALADLLESDEIFYLEPVFANTWLGVGRPIPGEAPGERSGTSVSLSGNGNRLAVGAPGNNGGSSTSYDVGQVRVYGWIGQDWLQMGEDIQGGDDGGRFGGSVSLSNNGKRLAIGADSVDDNGIRSGQVRVYSWSDGAWRQLGSNIDGVAAYSHSGSSVSISADGKRLAIGAPNNDSSGHMSGQVRVYKWRDKAWKQIGGAIDGMTAGEMFGYSVSLSSKGNYLAVGAMRNAENSGIARVYVWSEKEWHQVGAGITGNSGYSGFGKSVSLSASGKRLAVGSSHASYVKVYRLSGGQWKQLGEDVSGSGPDDRFGNSVSLSADGTRLAIGAEWEDDNGYNSGQIRVYTWTGKAWRQLLGNINGKSELQYFGQTVSLSGNGIRVASGAPGGRGYAGVYKMAFSEVPPPAVDPMRVNLLDPAHTEQIPQNNPETACNYHPAAGYGLRINFDWTDANSPLGIAGYHLKAQGHRAVKPFIDVFVTESNYSWVSCGTYVTNINASSGVAWTVQAKDENGALGPLNDEGYFVFELCYLNNGEPCG